MEVVDVINCIESNEVALEEMINQISLLTGADREEISERLYSAHNFKEAKDNIREITGKLSNEINSAIKIFASLIYHSNRLHRMKIR